MKKLILEYLNNFIARWELTEGALQSGMSMELQIFCDTFKLPFLSADEIVRHVETFSDKAFELDKFPRRDKDKLYFVVYNGALESVWESNSLKECIAYTKEYNILNNIVAEVQGIEVLRFNQNSGLGFSERAVEANVQPSFKGSPVFKQLISQLEECSLMELKPTNYLLLYILETYGIEESEVPHTCTVDKELGVTQSILYELKVWKGQNAEDHPQEIPLYGKLESGGCVWQLKDFKYITKEEYEVFQKYKI